MLRTVKAKPASFPHIALAGRVHQCSGADVIRRALAHARVLLMRAWRVPVLGLFASLPLPVETAGAATFRATPTASITESYTDNVRSARQGAEADWLTQAEAGARFRAKGSRLNLNLSASAVKDHYLDTDKMDGLRAKALGRGGIELLEDHFFVDSSVSLSEISTQRGGARSTIDRSLPSNRTQLLLYEVSPKLVNRFGRMLETTLEYSHSESRFSKPSKGVSAPLPDASGGLPGLNTIDSLAGRTQKSDDVSLKLDSGRYFTRMNTQLTLQTSTSKTNRGKSGSVTAGTGQSNRSSNKSKNDRADLVNEYQFTRHFSVIARAGFEDVSNHNPAVPTNPAAPAIPVTPTVPAPSVKDSSLSNKGATGSLGFRYRPGPRLSLRSEFGRSYGQRNISADLKYQISPFYNLSAEFSQSVRTQTGSRLDRLNGLIEAPDGSLIDPFTGVIRNPAASNFDLSTNSFREDLFQLGLTGRRGRNSYNLGVDFSSRESQSKMVKQEQLDVDLGYSRALWPRLSGNLNLGYSDQLKNENSTTAITRSSGEDKQYVSEASLNYQLGPSINTNFEYSYSKRKFDIVDDISESVVSASIQASF